ncbi:MAG: inorganic phosphate transporter [Chloroflexi bacterium]|nr:inorganic phosphate transporter [Chloroflexota bacterium]
MLNPVLLALIIALALAFDFINGFHDTANAIATSVSTRVLSPTQAILMSAFLNFLGAVVVGTAVASTIGKGIVEPSAVTQYTVMAALLGAIAWNLITWYLGIPTSSSHALIAGIVGASIQTAGLNVLNLGGLTTIFGSLMISPLVGLMFGFAAMIGLMWAFRKFTPSSVNGYFRHLQIASAAFMAFSHGSNDAQKTMGIITMSLVSVGLLRSFEVPLWVIVLSASAMALGTAVGGWKIIRTLGVRLVSLRPVNGFAAEASAAAIIQIATHFGAPVSTTHVISTSIMGVGASRRFSAVRWGVAGNIAMAWILTFPITMAFAWGIRFLLGVFVG